MSRNLSNLYISESFQYLIQESGSYLQTGLGSNLTGSLLITASLADNATTASYATTAASATSASYAVTASYALNVTPTDTGSLLKTASFSDAEITFTKGDGTTFNGVINNVTSSISASYATSAGTAATATSASYATTASYALYALSASGSVDTNALYTASVSDATITFEKGDTSTFNITVNNVVNADSASVATSADTAISASYATTASYALNVSTPDLQTVTDTGNTTTNAITASGFFTAGDAVVLGTASIGFLNVTYQSSSVIYSSGSNQFGDDASDTQTLYSTVDIKTGPVLVTGSVTSTDGFTGSLQGNADTATSASYVNVTNNGSDVNSNYVTFVTANGYTTPHTDTSLQFVPSTNTLSATNINATTFTGTLSGNASTATSASHAVNADVAVSSSYAVTASYALNAAGGAAFPYTGSAEITGSLKVIDKIITGNSANTISGTSPNCAVVGGEGNTISSNTPSANYIFGGANATINAGEANVIINGVNSTITAGLFNVLLGGNQKDITSGNYQMNAGGLYCDMTGGGSGAMLGGISNTYNGGNYGAVIAGSTNTVSHDQSVVIGGANITSSAANTVYVPNLTVTGSTEGVVGNNSDTYTSSPRVNQVVTLTQAEYNAIGTPDANTLYVISGSAANVFTGTQTFSGSVVGEVNALSIASTTASMDCSLSNFFTLALVDGSDTLVEASNIASGQTINLRLTNGAAGTGTVSFGAGLLKPSGFAFTGSAAANAVDVVSMISFDTNNLLINAVENFL